MPLPKTPLDDIKARIRDLEREVIVTAILESEAWDAYTDASDRMRGLADARRKLARATAARAERVERLRAEVVKRDAEIMREREAHAALRPTIDATPVANALRAFEGELNRAIKDLVNGWGYALDSLRIIDHNDSSQIGDQTTIRRVTIESAGRPVYQLIGSIAGGDSPRFDINGGFLAEQAK